jgi:hypothetical protein
MNSAAFRIWLCETGWGISPDRLRVRGLHPKFGLVALLDSYNNRNGEVHHVRPKRGTTGSTAGRPATNTNSSDELRRCTICCKSFLSETALLRLDCFLCGQVYARTVRLSIANFVQNSVSCCLMIRAALVMHLSLSMHLLLRATCKEAYIGARLPVDFSLTGCSMIDTARTSGSRSGSGGA